MPPPTPLSSHFFPGVYVEEIPGRGHPIAGVSTSVTAFIGWAARGPVDRALRVRSFGEFERQFGGLDRRSFLGYAVQQFFANGGDDAVIVRLVADDAGAAALTLDGKLAVRAASPGAWANDYRIETRREPADATRFQLTVFHQPTGQPAVTVERFERLSMQDTDARSVTRVVNAASELIRVDLVGTSTTPPADAAAAAFTTAGADGTPLNPNEAAFEAKLDPPGKDGGLYLLDRIDGFNLLCVPGQTSAPGVASLQAFCHPRRAFLIVDAPAGATVATMRSAPLATSADAANAALYFPWIHAVDPLDGNRVRAFPPCGAVAGLYARTDRTRGVWKAPAGTEAALAGATSLALALTKDAQGTLNPRAINCIRTLPSLGAVVWGSRTRLGAETQAADWRYVPVRRLGLFIEESLQRGTQWAVFEPNDEPLWTRLRNEVSGFLHGLFRQGAFQGTTPDAAFFVKCDGTTTTQADIDRGLVHLLVGFAPLKPAEFIVLRMTQNVGAGRP